MGVVKSPTMLHPHVDVNSLMFARGVRFSQLEVREQYHEDSQRVFDLQNKWVLHLKVLPCMHSNAYNALLCMCVCVCVCVCVSVCVPSTALLDKNDAIIHKHNTHNMHANFLQKEMFSYNH